MYHFNYCRTTELLSSGCGKSRGGRRRRRCVFGAFYAVAPRRRGGPNGALPLSPRLPLARTFIHRRPRPSVVSFGCCTVIMGPTDPLFYSLLAATGLLIAPIPMMGCQKGRGGRACYMCALITNTKGRGIISCRGTPCVAFGGCTACTPPAPCKRRCNRRRTK